VSFGRNEVWKCFRVLALSLPATVLPMRGQVESGPPANLEVFRRLAFAMGSDLGRRVGAAPLRVAEVTVVPREIGLPLERDFLQGLVASGADISRGDSSGLRFELAITEAHVLLEDPRRDGFLGSRIADRVVVLGGTAKMVGEGAGSAYCELSRSSRDTVRLSGVEGLESPALSFTKATMPRQGFFDNLIEPLVVLGAVGVAVYLLFAVRS
jgi:hypothetical protein